MTVEIWSKGQLDTTLVAGTLVEVVNAMNMTNAKGMQFIIMDEEGGGSVALETRNITRMREVIGDPLAY
jgi:hypothetical protein